MFASEKGQSTVELVALTPVILAVVLVLLQGFLAGAAHEYAGNAAEAAALAVFQDRDPKQAIKASYPSWLHLKVKYHRSKDGKRLSVEVEPPSVIPLLAKHLRAHETLVVGG